MTEVDRNRTGEEVLGVATVPEKSKRKAIVTDCRIIASLLNSWRSWRTLEQNISAMEERCKDFNSFIRDHRSQDDISLKVERITEDRCSVCDAEWEPLMIDGALRCANCEAEVEL